jgi:AcrR family transcriptional regulator
MPRLSRAERQAQTRAQLLVTARKLFLRDGYAATSVEKVAAAADLTKGAVYSNFRNKDELCLAVLDEIRAERMTEIAGLLDASTLDERLTRFEAWAERVIGDPEWTALELEFAMRSRHDPALRARMAESIHALTSAAGFALAAGARGAGIALPMPPVEMGTAALSLGVGMGLFRFADPDIPVSPMVDVIRVLAGLPQDNISSAG